MNGKRRTSPGCVLYTKGKEAGTLDARWCHAGFGSGTGRATGGTGGDGFEGCYSVCYFDEEGENISSFLLNIREREGYYELVWSKGKEPLIEGVGMETSEGLIAGWSYLDRKEV